MGIGRQGKQTEKNQGEMKIEQIKLNCNRVTSDIYMQKLMNIAFKA